MSKKPDNAAIWRDLEAKTRDLSAWVVMKNGEVVAKMVTHYGGRSSPNGLTVKGFVHILGLPCVRGIARGGGYDMRTAALAQACHKLQLPHDSRYVDVVARVAIDMFGQVVDQGHTVPHQLEAMGYTVVQVI